MSTRPLEESFDWPMAPGSCGYSSLGELKGNHGNENYVIPASLDPAGFRSVSIWCNRFNVSFGAAELTPV